MKIDKNVRTKTSSGFPLSQHAPLNTENPIPAPQAPAPDVLRVAYMGLQVTDLVASRKFYVDVLGLHVSYEDENEVYLRSSEEFIHHNLVLTQDPTAAVSMFFYRVRSPENVDAAADVFKEQEYHIDRPKNRHAKGISDSGRFNDPLECLIEVF